MQKTYTQINCLPLLIICLCVVKGAEHTHTDKHTQSKHIHPSIHHSVDFIQAEKTKKHQQNE